MPVNPGMPTKTDVISLGCDNISLFKSSPNDFLVENCCSRDLSNLNIVCRPVSNLSTQRQNLWQKPRTLSFLFWKLVD
jgi:hypothetical protein